MAEIQVVLFDLGNVLVDLGDESRFSNIFHVNSSDEAALWEMWLKSPAVKAFDTGMIPLEQFMQSLIREVGTHKTLMELSDDFVKWPIGLFDGAEAMVNQIPSHIHRAVLSNTNDAHWGRILDEMGLSGLFHTYFASHQVGLVKPDLKLYQHVVESLGVAPEQILFIDDNWINVEAARKVGMCAEQAKGVTRAQEILYTYGVIR